MKSRKKGPALAKVHEVAGPPSDTLGPLESIVCEVRARLVGDLHWWIDTYVDASWPSVTGDAKDLEENLRGRVQSACIDVTYLARRSRGCLRA
jgi:hypothetical protein